MRTVPPPFRAGDATLGFEQRTLVMGVLNVTPDSFSDGGRFDSASKAVDAGLRLAGDGADIIDVGGESSRPGAPKVPIDVELGRVIPVIAALRRAGLKAISVDTRNAAVARAAVDAGAGIINDISAMTHDGQMVDVAVRTRAAVVLMHMRGDPTTMQNGEIAYENVVEDVAGYLEARVRALAEAGVERSQILVDPGFGFGKTVQHNLELTAGVARFARSGQALVFGPSRKSTLGWLAGGRPAHERLEATVAACVMAADRGAHVVRVHDVLQVRQALAIVDAARGVYIAP